MPDESRVYNVETSLEHRSDIERLTLDNGRFCVRFEEDRDDPASAHPDLSEVSVYSDAHHQPQDSLFNIICTLNFDYVQKVIMPMELQATSKLSTDAFVLFAVNRHSGTPDFGHYLTFGRTIDDAVNGRLQWMRYDDSRVTPMPWRKMRAVLSCRVDPTVYLAWYFRCHTVWNPKKSQVSVVVFPSVTIPATGAAHGD